MVITQAERGKDITIKKKCKLFKMNRTTNKKISEVQTNGGNTDTMVAVLSFIFSLLCKKFVGVV